MYRSGWGAIARSGWRPAKRSLHVAHAGRQDEAGGEQEKVLHCLHCLYCGFLWEDSTADDADGAERVLRLALVRPIMPAMSTTVRIADGRAESEDEFEDGTNVAAGTQFREEAAGTDVPWYHPAKSKAPSNWKDKWATLRSAFERLIHEYCPVECVLIQHRLPGSSAPCHGAARIPPDFQQGEPGVLLEGGGFWPVGGGPHDGLPREPARLLGPDGAPLVGLFPFPLGNLKEQPMVNSRGEPLAFRFGFRRQFYLRKPPGSPGDRRPLPDPQLLELARDGTNLLYQLPASMALSVWRNWRSGFARPTNAGESPWLDVLFELSWQHRPSSPRHSARYAWAAFSQHSTCALVGAGLLPRLPSGPSIPSEQGLLEMGFFHDHRYPLACYAQLSDAARTSVAAIDEILERERIMGGSTAAEAIEKPPERPRPQSRRFSIALSFPGEHRAFVGEVASRVASGVGRERVLYDKYFEAEFARPDLDIYLPNLYRTESELIAIFLCADYAEKQWCKLEWRFIRQLICTSEAHRIMFLSFDDIEAVPELGILSGDGYVSIGRRPPGEIARLILQRYGAVAGCSSGTVGPVASGRRSVP